MPTLLSADEAAYIVRHSGAQTLLDDATFAAIAHGSADTAGVQAWEIARLGADEVESVDSYAHREAEDVAVVFYTGFTAGS